MQQPGFQTCRSKLSYCLEMHKRRGTPLPTYFPVVLLVRTTLQCRRRHRDIPSTPRSSQSQVSPYQDVFQRGGHAVVSASGRPAGLDRVLHAHRYVVSCGGWQGWARALDPIPAFPPLQCRGSSLPFISPCSAMHAGLLYRATPAQGCCLPCFMRAL